jgi:hypothetical protein
MKMGYTEKLGAFYKRVRKIAKSEYYLCHVSTSVGPSDRMEQPGFRWTGFHEISYLGIC